MRRSITLTRQRPADLLDISGMAAQARRSPENYWSVSACWPAILTFSILSPDVVIAAYLTERIKPLTSSLLAALFRPSHSVLFAAGRRPDRLKSASNWLMASCHALRVAATAQAGAANAGLAPHPDNTIGRRRCRSRARGLQQSRARSHQREGSPDFEQRDIPISEAEGFRAGPTARRSL